MGSRPCHHISVEQTNRKFLSPYCDQFYSSNHKQRIHRHAGGVLLNNELVHRRRRATVTEMETPPNIVKSPTGKRYPTVAEYLEISRKKKSALPKRSSSRGNAAKTAKKTAVKKKRTRNT